MARMVVSHAGRGFNPANPAGPDHLSPPMEAEFVYSVAAELVTHDNSLGEQSRARFPNQHKTPVKKVIKDDANDAEEGIRPGFWMGARHFIGLQVLVQKLEQHPWHGIPALHPLAAVIHP